MEINNFFGTGKYVLGILSIVSSLFNPIQGILLGFFGLLIERDSKNSYTRKGNILNWIGIVIGIVVWIVIALSLGSFLKSQTGGSFPAA
jgi:hypothetical protein